jgi:hypothetical protein
MAEATNYGTLSSARVLYLLLAGIRPRAVFHIRVVVPFLLFGRLFCCHRLVQEPRLLRGHHAGSSPLSSALPLPFFPFFFFFFFSRLYFLLNSYNDKRNPHQVTNEIVYPLLSPPTLALFISIPLPPVRFPLLPTFLSPSPRLMFSLPRLPSPHSQPSVFSLRPSPAL